MRCDAAVAEKPAGEEAAGEQFEYQAEVRHGQGPYIYICNLLTKFLIGVHPYTLSFFSPELM